MVCRRTGRRGKPIPKCGCGCAADLLCDGPAASGTCDAPICANCATEIGPDRHLCPSCRASRPDRTTALVEGILGAPEPLVAAALAQARALAELEAFEATLGPCWHCKGRLGVSLSLEHVECKGGPTSIMQPWGSAPPCGFRYLL